METYLRDVCTQPEQLRRAMDFYEKKGFLGKIGEVGRLPFKKLVFSGMGSSCHSALGASIYLKRHGVESQVISTGELLYYEKECLDRDTLLVLISQSGESAETVKLIGQLPKNLPVVAITNEVESALGARGQVVLPLFVDREESVTTRTYLSSVCVTMLLAAWLAKGEADGMLRGIRKAIGALEAVVLGQEEIKEKLLHFQEGCTALSIMGRGYSLGSVEAAALFFQEVVKFPAIGFDGAEFKHGPLEMAGEGFRALVFAPGGPTMEIGCAMAENMVSKGGRVVLVTDESYGQKFSRQKLSGQKEKSQDLTVFSLPQVAEWLAPICQIGPAQLLADSMAKERGIRAGEFRWGSKVMEAEI